MKRREFLQYLHEQGCRLFREGAKHSVWYHPITNKASTIPRHREVKDWLVVKICRDLGVPAPRKT
jgi:mRNA interferase HicA